MCDFVIYKVITTNTLLNETAPNFEVRCNLNLKKSERGVINERKTKPIKLLSYKISLKTLSILRL